jgi:basic membrane protein A
VQGVAEAGASARVIEPSTPDGYAAALGECLSGHASLVLAVSQDMAPALAEVAGSEPSSHFVLVDGQLLDSTGHPQPLANVAELVFDARSAGYLVGVLAGLMEQQKVGAATHNVTGILGSNHTPQVDAYIAGYVAGARSVDAPLAVKLAYSDSTDSDFCRSLGRGQITAGADILFEVAPGCASGYIGAAYDASVYAIGSETDQAGLSPAVITSAIKRIDRGVAQEILQARAGNFQGGERLFGLNDEGTGYSTPSSVVPQGIIDQVEDVKARIRSGIITPPSAIPS